MEAYEAAWKAHLGPVLREERKAFFRYRPGLLGDRRVGSKRENNTQEKSCYLRPGLVSVSDALVLGVMTLVYRIPVNSEKLKRVNLRNSDAGYGVLLHHEFGKGISKRRKLEVSKSETRQS